MPIQKSEALVLKKIDFRETSLIVHFYTRDFGKISGILKGIRKDPKKFASNLEIFSLNEIVFYEKRVSSLHLVSQCDMKDNFDSLRHNLSKINQAALMTELLSVVMPDEDKNEEVFDLMASCLQELKNNAYPEKIATIFKIKMLALSGFKPHFDSCVSCQNKIFGQSKFSLSLGGLLCEHCWQKDTAGRLIFRGTIATILHIEKNDLKNNLTLGMNPQVKKELDIILNAFLNFHLERELKSQRVINKINSFAQISA